MHYPDSSTSWRDSFISYGVLIDDRVLFTSDTKNDPDLINGMLGEFKSIKFIFHDVQLFTGGIHASYEELLKYPEETRSIMCLTHYGDNFEEYDSEKDKFAGFAKQGHFYVFD